MMITLHGLICAMAPKRCRGTSTRLGPRPAERASCCTCTHPPKQVIAMARDRRRHQRDRKQRLACSASLGAVLLAAITAKASTAPAIAAAGPTAIPPLLAVLSSVLPSFGVFLLCISAAVFLAASIPTMWAMGRAAARAERVLAVVEKELPDTISAMRLSGLEVTDCIHEIGAFSGELTRGVRSTAQLATMAEQGVRLGVAAVDGTIKHTVKPAIAKSEADARGGQGSCMHVACVKCMQCRPPRMHLAKQPVAGGRRPG